MQKQIKIPFWKALVSFVILFILYHGAEYLILFKNSTLGFLLVQGLFFAAAWILGNWYSGNGWAAWGLALRPAARRLLAWGLLAGCLLYAVAWLLSLGLGMERISQVPKATEIFTAALPFGFGLVFSSLSEDILTRGLVYAHFRGRIPGGLLALLSALIYLLNHIYRLGAGPQALLYLFFLGIVFILPVIYTRQLWFTAAMHWAGNLFFFVTRQCIQTIEVPGKIAPNYVFTLCLLAAIPLIRSAARKLSGQPERLPAVDSAYH